MNNLSNQRTYKSMVCGCDTIEYNKVFFKPSFKFCDPERFSPSFNYCTNIPPIAPDDITIIYDGGNVEGYS